MFEFWGLFYSVQQNISAPVDGIGFWFSFSSEPLLPVLSFNFRKTKNFRLCKHLKRRLKAFPHQQNIENSQIYIYRANKSINNNTTIIYSACETFRPRYEFELSPANGSQNNHNNFVIGIKYLNIGIYLKRTQRIF